MDSQNEALRRINQCLRTGSYDALPDDLANNALLLEILDYLQQAQQSLVLISHGDISTTVSLKGYTGGTLKALQSNLRHVVWKAHQIAAGDFSQQIDFMSEITDAFNSMGKELERAQAKLQKLAAEDPLTGLANRRNFFALAQREVDRMRRTGRQACIAMLDIDKFKTLNDTLGHRQGDLALRRLTKLITATIRSYDIAGRYGGDEFIILFSDATPDIAYAVLERLRLSVQDSHLHEKKSDAPQITISAGISSVDINVENVNPIDHSIMHADAALYASKSKGRNCVSLA